MTTNVVVFGFGAILLLVAILGGGFELKELKVPKVGWASRLVAGLAGLCFVFWGVAIPALIPDAAARVPAAANQAPPTTLATPAPPPSDQSGAADRPAQPVTFQQVEAGSVRVVLPPTLALDTPRQVPPNTPPQPSLVVVLPDQPPISVLVPPNLLPSPVKPSVPSRVRPLSPTTVVRPPLSGPRLKPPFYPPSTPPPGISQLPANHINPNARLQHAPRYGGGNATGIGTNGKLPPPKVLKRPDLVIASHQPQAHGDQRGYAQQAGPLLQQRINGQKPPLVRQKQSQQERQGSAQASRPASK